MSAGRVRKVWRYDLLVHRFEPTSATDFLLYIFIDISKVIYLANGARWQESLIGSRMSFRFVPKSVTLNGEINDFIFRYFTEFGSFRGALTKSGWQSHNYLRLDYYV